jgi:hypothetical protein
LFEIATIGSAHANLGVADTIEIMKATTDKTARNWRGM